MYLHPCILQLHVSDMIYNTILSQQQHKSTIRDGIYVVQNISMKRSALGVLLLHNAKNKLLKHYVPASIWVFQFPLLHG